MFRPVTCISYIVISIILYTHYLNKYMMVSATHIQYNTLCLQKNGHARIICLITLTEIEHYEYNI